MSDKELVLDALERLPNSATLDQIRDRLNFLAAIRQAQNSLSQAKAFRWQMFGNNSPPG